MDLGAECSARSICFDLLISHFLASIEPAGFDEEIWSAVVGWGGGVGGLSNDEGVLICDYQC